MTDDVATFLSLSRRLVVDVLRYQSSPRFGLGSFQEKPTYPHGYWWRQAEDSDQVLQTYQWPTGSNGAYATDALTPCPTRTDDSGPFTWAFCHEQDLSDDYNLLPRTIAQFVNHPNNDWAENSIEALMFASVCDLQWRDGAKRVVLVATDAMYQTPLTTTTVYPQESSYSCGQALGTPQNDPGDPNVPTAPTDIPGVLEDYPDPDVVSGLVSGNNIIPIIASANAPPDHEDYPEWSALINGWGFGTAAELAGDSSNLIDIIRDALEQVSTVMLMTLCQTCDPAGQVSTWEPQNGHPNVEAGGQRSFVITMLDDAGLVEEETIVFSVVGFGEVEVVVTNSIPCLGCDGSNDPSVVVDLCGVCDGDNDCVGCDNVAYSGARVDRCGVCLGNGSSCTDCLDVPFGNARFDQCGICAGDGLSCIDCLGVVHGPGDTRPWAEYDLCGVCNGTTDCRGCDGVVNSTLEYDECDICGGSGDDCKAVKPPPPSQTPAVVAAGVAAAVFIVLVILAVLAIVALLAKKKWDQIQYMNNQQMTAVGTNPTYENTGGWQENLVSN